MEAGEGVRKKEVGFYPVDAVCESACEMRMEWKR